MNVIEKSEDAGSEGFLEFVMMLLNQENNMAATDKKNEIFLLNRKGDQRSPLQVRHYPGNQSNVCYTLIFIRLKIVFGSIVAGEPLIVVG